MTRLTRFALLLAVLCLPASRLHAQFVAKEIVFSGAPQFAQADMLSVSGLHPGKTLTNADINAGAQALADSGFFSSINFAYSGTTLTYKVTPMEQANMLPAKYDNFIWWTPEELNAELHRRHPLYTGMIPQAGKLMDQLTGDLTAMLAAKGLVAEVTPSISPAADCITYTIISPDIRVHSLQISGLDPSLDKYEAHVHHAFENQAYSDLLTPEFLRKAVVGALQDEGYLDAGMDSYQHGAPMLTDKQITVDLAIGAHAGEQYHIASVDWAGSPQLSVDDFYKLTTLKPGSVPSASAWGKARGLLHDAYAKQGYLVAKTDIQARLDRTAHTAAYTVRVAPGGQYTLHSMTLDGVTDKQRQEFMNTWKMPNNAPYDATYVHTFLQANPKTLHSLDGYSLKYKEIINDQTRTLDLQVQIRKD